MRSQKLNKTISILQVSVYKTNERRLKRRQMGERRGEDEATRGDDRSKARRLSEQVPEVNRSIRNQQKKNSSVGPDNQKENSFPFRDVLDSSEIIIHLPHTISLVDLLLLF